MCEIGDTHDLKKEFLAPALSLICFLSFLPSSWSSEALALENGAKGIFYRQLADRKQVTNIGLTYSIELIRDGKTAMVDSRYPFVSGDQFRFHLQANVDAYLYIILQEGSHGESAMLFPALPEDNNHISAGADLLVPAKGTLQFDNLTGTEKVRLLLSVNKMPIESKMIQSDPNSFSRSIVITPKHPVDSVAAKCMIDFASKDASQAVFTNTVNPPNFAQQPAVTVVSAEPSNVLAVEMDLCHGSRRDAAEENTSNLPALNRTVSNLAASSSVVKTFTQMSPDNTTRLVTDKWAVIVGVSQFKNPHLNLLFPAKDAEDLGKFLVREGHFAPDHVKVLTNSNATRENILTTLGSGWLPHNAKLNDLVLVYFATHGTSAAMDAAEKNFLVAYDTDPKNAFVSGIELQDLARTIKRRINSDRIIIVLDTCHSGAAEPGAKSLLPLSFSFEDLIQGTGQLVIASASQNQAAHDSRRYKNGIFTKHLIDGLRQNKELKDAFEYTRTKVEEESMQDFNTAQSPVLKDGEWHGADIVLVVPPDKPGPARD